LAMAPWRSAYWRSAWTIFSIITFSIKDLLATLRINDIQHKGHPATEHKCHHADCYCAECLNLFIVMLSVTMLIVIMLSIMASWWAQANIELDRSHTWAQANIWKSKISLGWVFIFQFIFAFCDYCVYMTCTCSLLSIQRSSFEPTLAVF
jgi:hypothetical protein